MSDAEALMWDLEKEPSLRSAFLNVTFLDAHPDVAEFRRRITRATVELPRLRQRVIPEPFHLAPPRWEDDPSFDIGFHVRHLGVPGPGTDRQLLDLAALHYADPFDRARPLWQFTIVEGLEGDRAALLAKMHHTITDGVGGVRLSAMFIDLERNPDVAAAVADAAPAADAAGNAQDTSFLSDLVDSLAHSTRRRLGIGRRIVGEGIDAALHPARLGGRAADSVELVRSLLRQAVVTERAHSPLWAGKRSIARRFEVLSIDLDGLKTAAKSLGGTINDAFVTGVAGGIGAYHRHHGADVDELRMAMPISTRSDRSAGGNSFVPTRLLVPVGTRDAQERFALVQQRLDRTKHESAISVTDTMATLINGLPTYLLVRFARAQAGTTDFAVSNVRGAPFDLFIAGAHIEANHPMGPTGGTACNLTVLSYRTSLDMGINVDTAAIPDPEVLRDCVAASFDELLMLG